MVSRYLQLTSHLGPIFAMKLRHNHQAPKLPRANYTARFELVTKFVFDKGDL